jgi:hypothetical protein
MSMVALLNLKPVSSRAFHLSTIIPVAPWDVVGSCQFFYLNGDVSRIPRFVSSDLLSNRRLRNSYFSVTLKNTHQLHFSRRKVQLHFSVRKVQLVAVALFFKLRLYFSEWLRNNYFSGDWYIGKPLFHSSPVGIHFTKRFWKKTKITSRTLTFTTRPAKSKNRTQSGHQGPSSLQRFDKLRR